MQHSDHEAASSIMSESREIRLPEDLCVAAEERFGSEFRALDDLLIFLLQELLRRDTIDIDRADQKMVEERLKDLGYI